MNKVINKQKGLLSVEIIIGITITSLVLLFTTHALTRFVSIGSTIADKTHALYLAEGALELVRFIRDEDLATFEGFSNNTSYYLEIETLSIGVTTTPEVIDGTYTRYFVLDDVYRDTNDDIVASTTAGASADSDARYITAFVVWNTGTSTLTTILADIEGP